MHSFVKGEKLKEGTPLVLCQRRKQTDLVDQGYHGSDGSTVGDMEARDKVGCLCFTMQREMSLLFAVKSTARCTSTLGIEALRFVDLDSS